MAEGYGDSARPASGCRQGGAFWFRRRSLASDAGILLAAIENTPVAYLVSRARVSVCQFGGRTRRPISRRTPPPGGLL